MTGMQSWISQEMKDNSRFLNEKVTLLQQCFWHHFIDFIPNNFHVIKIGPELLLISGYEKYPQNEN